MKAAAIITTALLLTTNAYASNTSLDSLGPLELLDRASQHSEDDSIWGLRVMNTQIIGKHSASLEAFKWCNLHNDNAAACTLFARLSRESESGIPDAIKMNEKIIAHVESLPRTPANAAHLKALRQQLSIIKNMPTPFNDVLRAAVKEQSR